MFLTSPAAALLPSPSVFSNADTLDIVAFLEAVFVDPPPEPPVPGLSPWSILLLAALLFATPPLAGTGTA